MPLARISALLLALLLAACTPGAAPPAAPARQAGAPEQPRARTRFVVAVMSEPASLANIKTNPRGTIGNLAGIDELVALVHVGLAAADDAGVLRPVIAEAVPSIENGLWRLLPDGRMETTWRIRPDAQWHDGTPFTAADLLFTLQVEQDRGVPFGRMAPLALVEGIEAPDPRTVTVTWKQPFVEADTLFTETLSLAMPKHLLEESYLQDKENLINVPYWHEGFIGTGPFKVKSWTSGSQVLLEANDRYVLGRPKIDELEVKFVADPNTLIANILAGTVELNMGRGLDIEQGLKAREQRPDLKLMTGPGGWMQIYPQFLNPSPAIVADVRFRRALFHAIDRQEIVDTIQAGLAPVAHSFVRQDWPEWRDVESSTVMYEHDPRRAAQLIGELGYTRGADGMFRDSSAQPLAIEMRTTAQFQVQTKTLFPVAAYWQGVGVSVDSVVVPIQRITDREYRANFPAFELITAGNTLTSTRVKLFHSSNTARAENGYQANGNYARYVNPAFDAMLDRFAAAIPRAERMQALAQIVQHQTENLTLLPLFHAVNPTITSERASGFKPGVGNIPWNAHEWNVT